MIFCPYCSSTAIFFTSQLIDNHNQTFISFQYSFQNLTICHIFTFGTLLEIVVSVQTSGVCD